MDFSSKIYADIGVTSVANIYKLYREKSHSGVRGRGNNVDKIIIESGRATPKKKEEKREMAGAKRTRGEQGYRSLHAPVANVMIGSRKRNR